MSGLLAALSRLEGRGPAAASPPAAPTPAAAIPSSPTLTGYEPSSYAAPSYEPPVYDPLPAYEPPPVETAPEESTSDEIADPVSDWNVAPIYDSPALVDEVETTAPAAIETPADLPLADGFVARLTAACPAPALVAFIGIGLEESPAATIRDLAEGAARDLNRDVVMFGPGMLDDVASMERHGSALDGRAAYGFIHASAEYAAGRLAALQSAAGVVVVVDLERTSTRAVEAFRDVAATHGIKLLGAIALRGE